MPPKVDREVQKLRSLLNDISRIESRRHRVIETLRDRAKADNITSAILAEASRFEHTSPMRNVEPADFDDLFTTRLAKYDEDAAIVVRESQDQDDLAGKLREANASFLSARKAGSSEGLKEREEALQTLENAYTKYKEVIGNLDSGRMFYNNLATLVARFRDEVKQFVHNRRLQAEQIEVYVFFHSYSRCPCSIFLLFANYLLVLSKWPPLIPTSNIVISSPPCHLSVSLLRYNNHCPQDNPSSSHNQH